MLSVALATSAAPEESARRLDLERFPATLASGLAVVINGTAAVLAGTAILEAIGAHLVLLVPIGLVLDILGARRADECHGVSPAK
jgi:uncharacterized membrane protein YdfJ with MMPL/SSD domain